MTFLCEFRRNLRNNIYFFFFVFFPEFSDGVGTITYFLEEKLGVLFEQMGVVCLLSLFYVLRWCAFDGRYMMEMCALQSWIKPFCIKSAFFYELLISLLFSKIYEIKILRCEEVFEELVNNPINL